MTPVICPTELTDLTGFRRSNSNFTLPGSDTIVRPIEPNANIDTFDRSNNDYKTNNDYCGFNAGPNLPGQGCLSRMMDCRKPSASVPDNLVLSDMEDNMKILNGCSKDGYTRIQTQQGCPNQYC